MKILMFCCRDGSARNSAREDSSCRGRRSCRFAKDSTIYNDSCHGSQYSCDQVQNSTFRVKVVMLVSMWKIPSSEKDRAMAHRMNIYISLVVTSLKILRLETIVVIRIRILWLVYARNVHITSRIKPVIKGLQMIWRMDTAITVERILFKVSFSLPLQRTKRVSQTRSRQSAHPRRSKQNKRFNRNTKERRKKEINTIASTSKYVLSKKQYSVLYTSSNKRKLYKTTVY